MNTDATEETPVLDPEQPLEMNAEEVENKGDAAEHRSQKAIPQEREAAANSEKRKLIRYFFFGFLLAAILGIIIGVIVSQTKDDTSVSGNDAATPSPTTAVPTIPGTTAEPSPPPTPPPPVIKLPVQTVYNIRINDDVDPGSYIPDLEAAMDILVPKVITETFPSARLRRMLLVTISEGTEIAGRLTASKCLLVRLFNKTALLCETL